MNDIDRESMTQGFVTRGMFLPVSVSILAGGLIWALLGAVLNIMIPVLGLIICCERLGSFYYTIAYWLPFLGGGAVAALALWRQFNHPV